MIRFTIEPNNTQSASPQDPLNQKPTEDLITRATVADANFDTTICEYLKAALFFDDDEAARLRRENPEHLAPQSYLAFDFEKDGRILGKLSLFLFWKAKQTGQLPRDIAFNLMIGIPIIGPSFEAALRAWERCLKTFPAEFGGEPRVEWIGFDLLPPSQDSRIKPYLRL